MKLPAVALRIASALFGLMGLVHLVRIIVATNIYVGHTYIGRRWSALAALILIGIAVWLWRVASSADKGTTPPTPRPTT